MPVYVQWKWQEKTKTFLVVFHFDNDFSKSNLRTKRMTFGRHRFMIDRWYVYTPEHTYGRSSLNHFSSKNRTVLTWAPSHIETGLLSEILGYANIINGLPDEKKKLLKTMPVFCEFLDDMKPDMRALLDVQKLKKMLGDKMCSMYAEEIIMSTVSKGSFCAELCPEYIDYLKEILKPYLK